MILSVQLYAGRDVVVYHDQVELFFAFFCVGSGEEHTVTLNTHHDSRREVGDRNQGLADELFRLVISVNTGENGAIILTESKLNVKLIQNHRFLHLSSFPLIDLANFHL